MGEPTNVESAMLEQLTKEREEIDELISALQKRIASRSASAVGGLTASGGKVSPDEFFRLNTPEAIKKFLRIVGKPARSTQEIIDGLKFGGMETNYTNVYTALQRLQKRDKVVAKVGENWGLEEWYPRAASSKEKPAEELSEENSEEDRPLEIEAAPNSDHPKVNRKQVMADFIKAHGPSTRAEILAGTEIPEGSFTYCAKDKDLFVQGEDGKWRNVE